MTIISLSKLFHIDSLAIVLMVLVVFIGLAVASFSFRYLRGDTQYNRFFTLVAILMGSVIAMVSSDHLLVLLVAWGVSNLLLVKLMVHKASWKAARASGVLSVKNFFLGFGFVASAFTLLYGVTGQTSVRTIVHSAPDSSYMILVLVLILLGAMTQSAIWPFHRWLTSSLNSPTPTSAIMHAGLVNGGGFLLARFAPLYFDAPILLTVIFIMGLATALIGTLWKLMQQDVKRELACSTMGQMGFMLAQCGLGLFPAAVAHLCWHGMFKAYLFLASGSAAQEKRLDLRYPPSLLSFTLALICGVIGSYGFSLMSHMYWLSMDTTLILVAIAFIASSQFALPMLRRNPLKMLPIALIASGAMGGLHGASVHLIEAFLTPMNLMHPQPLNFIHLAGLALLALAWLAILFGRHLDRSGQLPNWILHFYVKALNASQPHSTTITAHRNHYKYL